MRFSMYVKFLHFLSWVRYLNGNEKGAQPESQGWLNSTRNQLEFAKGQRGDSNLLEAENKKLKEENAKLVV